MKTGPDGTGLAKDGGLPRTNSYALLFGSSADRVHGLFERAVDEGILTRRPERISGEIGRALRLQGVSNAHMNAVGGWCAENGLPDYGSDPGRADWVRSAIVVSVLLDDGGMRDDIGETFAMYERYGIGRAVLTRGLPWLLDMLDSFMDGAHAVGLRSMKGDVVYRSDTPRAMLSTALNHLTTPGLILNPVAFGRALVDSYVDIHGNGMTASDCYLFPSLESFVLWRDSVRTHDRIPYCAATIDGMEWLEAIRLATGSDSRPWSEFHGRLSMRMAERGIAPVIAHALASDGIRDYVRPRSLITHTMMGFHGSDSGQMRQSGMRSPVAGDARDIVSMITECDSDAAVLGILDLCDVLMISGGWDPERGFGMLSPLDDDGHPIEGDGTAMVAVDVIEYALDMLNRGLPVDMVAEDPVLRAGR